jgi:hypothetical protein
MNYYLKEPSASIDYSFDWNAGYLNGQTVSASTWAATPTEAGGISVVSSAILPTQTSALVTGGAAGHVYRLTNVVIFSDGRSDERQVVLRVEER